MFKITDSSIGLTKRILTTVASIFSPMRTHVSTIVPKASMAIFLPLHLTSDLPIGIDVIFLITLTPDPVPRG